MSAYHGRLGKVYIGANQIGEVTGWTYDEEGEKTDVAALGDTGKRSLTGFVTGGGTLDMYFDDGDTEQEALEVGDDVELHLYWRGMGSGLPELTSVGNEASGLAHIDKISYAGDASSASTRKVAYSNRMLRDTQT